MARLLLTTDGNGAATVVNDAAIEFAASTVRGALTCNGDYRRYNRQWYGHGGRQSIRDN